MAAVFAMSACGGDDAPSAAPTVSTERPSGSASPAAEELGLWPDDFVLTEGPATSGFTGAPGEPADDGDDPEEDAVLRASAECLGVPLENVDYEPEATADGLTFTGDGGETQIDSTAEIVTREQAAFDRELLANPRMADCLAEAFESQIGELEEEGVDFEIISAETLGAPAGAQGRCRIVMQASGPGGTVEVAMDLLFFVEGQVEVMVGYTTSGEEPQPERLRQIADQISTKLRNQQPRSIAGRPTEGGPVIGAFGPLHS
ncbi:hypothetical protein [Parafrankia sp. FMc2]|uniref:hypothetical protein n=1 Tax=Parafrankia sp. FMc2 TaxID=3233196 RepID=UPI0034D3DC9E